jgi:hypothetical protein
MISEDDRKAENKSEEASSIAAESILRRQKLKAAAGRLSVRDMSFPIVNLIHVFLVAGRHRYSTPHVSWNFGEASRTEAEIRPHELSRCTLPYMLGGLRALRRF